MSPTIGSMPTIEMTARETSFVGEIVRLKLASGEVIGGEILGLQMQPDDTEWAQIRLHGGSVRWVNAEYVEWIEYESEQSNGDVNE